MLGGSLVLLAVLWLVAALLDFPTWMWVPIGVVAALTLVGGVVPAIRPPVLLEISSDGYRVRRVRGAGVAAARWSEVERVEDGVDGTVLSVTLSGGRHTMVPLQLLGDAASTASREMHDRLNAAYGYRRLSGG